MISIAVDAMGGDFGPSVTVPAVMSEMRSEADFSVVFVGDRDAIGEQVARHEIDDPRRIRVEHADEVVEMTDAPAQALRSKRASSMRVAMNLLGSGEVGACVSAGNTGALMAISRYVLGTFPGIQRPAIIGQIPTVYGSVHMLDLGANVDSSPLGLLQFGLMGSTFVKYMHGKPAPRVALLNNGTEDIKGTETVKAAAKLFAESELNYCGYIEGDGIYLEEVDVIVCDGFLGNIALKTSEGVSKLIQHAMKKEFDRNVLRRISGLLAMPAIKGLRSQVDPRVHNGAALLGLKGVVVKSHGGADLVAYAAAVHKAVSEAKNDVAAKIGSDLSASLGAANELFA